MLQTRTIYSLLLPQEESYRFAKDTLMIREETLPDIGVTEACLTSAVANKFKDAIAGFNRFHSKKWLLQRQFQIEKPYKIVSSGVIAALPDYPPSSAAYVEMSPVGFNHEKLRPSFILAVLAVVSAAVGVSICLKNFTATGKKHPSLPAYWHHKCCKIAIASAWRTTPRCRRTKNPETSVSPAILLRAHASDSFCCTF